MEEAGASSALLAALVGRGRGGLGGGLSSFGRGRSRVAFRLRLTADHDRRENRSEGKDAK